MYTRCEIQWIDDLSVQNVVIKATDDFDVADEKIFFYGLTREDLIAACHSGEVLEKEWKVLSVGETFDEF